MKQGVVFFFAVWGALYASECTMHIEDVKHDLKQFTLVVSHDAYCEIIMDENSSKIVLVPKPVDRSRVEENETKEGNTAVEKLLALARSKLGDSYLYGATGPEHFDCSGFVYYTFKENGIVIPRTSLEQSRSGKQLTREAIKKGDILFFDTHERGHVNHSGIYLGEGKFIHASSGKAYGVTISELDKGFYKDKFCWGIRKLED